MTADRPLLLKRARVIAVVLITFLLCVLAGIAVSRAEGQQAPNVTLTVVNSDGYPQPDTGVWLDGNGQVCDQRLSAPRRSASAWWAGRGRTAHPIGQR